MTKNNTTLSTEDMLRSLFEEDAACEVENHYSAPSCHSGEGQWYMTVGCNSCDMSDTVLTCEKYRNTLLGVPHYTAICMDCKTKMTVAEAVRSWVRRG